MDSLARLLLRFVLVPLGYFAAVVVATLVIVLGSWKLGAAAAHPDTQAFAIFGFVFAAPVLLIMLLSLMWLAAAIRILISDGVALPSLHVSRRHRRALGFYRLELVRLRRCHRRPAEGAAAGAGCRPGRGPRL